jgi:hypothetical protein
MSDLQSFLPGLTETAAAFTAIGPVQALVASGAALWLALLSLPLRGVDRRDAAAGFTYVLFHVAAGTALVLGLSRGLADGRDVLAQVGVVSLLGIVAGLRWAVVGRYRRPSPGKLQAGAAGKKGAT